MREIIRAAGSGFCFGVRQAIEKTEEQIRENGGQRRIFTWGPLIHNSLVTDDLAARGVTIAGDLSLVDREDVLIVRSHGEGKALLPGKAGL